MTVIGKVRKLQRILDEAYDHYFENSDGHCKSNEGSIALQLGTYFDRKSGEGDQYEVQVYSYVFGPGRHHYFSSMDEAIEWAEHELDDELVTERDETGLAKGSWDW